MQIVDNNSRKIHMVVQDGPTETTEGWNNKWRDDKNDTRKIINRILPKLQCIDLVL
jgi:hypothetical protein